MAEGSPPLSFEEQHALDWSHYVADSQLLLHSHDIDDSPGKLAIILPGMLDVGSLANTATLRSDLQQRGVDARCVDVFEIDDYRYPRKAEERKLEAQRHAAFAKDRNCDAIYNGDWSPGVYMRVIKRIIDQNPAKEVLLAGFSYGAQTALLYATIDAAMQYNRVNAVAALMPPQFYTGVEYDPGRAFDAAISARGYLGVEHETFSYDVKYSPSDPQSRFYRVMMRSGEIVTRHLKPWVGLNPDEPPSNSPLVKPLAGRSINHRTANVIVSDMTQFTPLKYVAAKTLVIAGEHDTVSPPSVVQQIYDNIGSPAKRLKVVDVDHDYRDSPASIRKVNDIVLGWLASKAVVAA